MDEYYQAVQALPAFLSQPLGRVPGETARRIHEIRLRAGCPLWLTVDGRLCPAQLLPGGPPELCGLRLNGAQIEEAFYALCGGSVHAHQAELAEGYLTLPGGHRVGVGGQYLAHPEEGVILRRVRSLNIRVARLREAALPPSLTAVLQGRFTGLLVAGEPDSGKTTLLRSIARWLSEQARAVAVIDEREELWPAAFAAARCPPLDILSGLPKGRAVQMALSTLAPQDVKLDELGGMEEVQGLEQGFFGGVDFVASLHAASMEELLRRPQVTYMKRQQMIRVVVLLEGRQAPGRIKGVHFL